MMKHAGGEYVDAALDDAETTGDVEDQEGEAADMLGAEEKRRYSTRQLKPTALRFWKSNGWKM